MYLKAHTLLFIVFFAFLFCGCKKGEEVAVQRSMRLRIEALYTDTSLYEQVKLGDSILKESKVAEGNKMILLFTGNLTYTDSGRLTITIIKKNNPSITVDTTIRFWHTNEFLLLQLDPRQKPVFIDKKKETANHPQKNSDSVNIRFYYNADDDIRRNGNLLKSIDLQLYSYALDSLTVNAPYEPSLRTEQKIAGIKSGELSNYTTLAIKDSGGKQRGYVFDIYPPGSTAATKPQYPRQFDEFDGYIGGGVQLGTGSFQTLRITKKNTSSPYRLGKFLFGF